ncbi:MAG TPA: hypothetical protein VLX92_11430 [Kofleriaceae bacterium]|nr:hypothetical protein [Kofleriaceae bacterium]
MKLGLVVACVVCGCTTSNPPAALVATVPEPAGANCPDGGIAIETGRDLDGNGTLDPDEVTATSYVCNPGARELVAIVPEPAGANCANGGEAIEMGADVNGNRVLDPGEVTSTSYVCSGPPGVATLVAVVPEPPGANCANGGQAIETGADLNDNGVLDADEVTSTSYVCSSADGLSALIRVDVEPPGANCAAGGEAIRAGLDLNRDGVLEDSEIQSTTYLCAALSGVTEIDGDVVVHNSLEAAQLDGVVTITGTLTIDSMTPFDASFPTLQQVGGGVECDGGCVLSSLAMPSLRSTRQFIVDSPLTSLDLSALHDLESLDVRDALITSLNLPSLVDGGIALELDSNLATISAPQLAIGSIEDLQSPLASVDLSSLVSGSVELDGPGPLTSLSLPSLGGGTVQLDDFPALSELSIPGFVGGTIELGGVALTSLSAPAWSGSDHDELWISGDPQLTTIALPALTMLQSLEIESNAALTTIAAPNLTRATTLTITNNAALATCQAQALATQSNATTVTISGDDDAGTCP